MSSQNFRRALFVRLDRIGDLVLTLPTDSNPVFEKVDWWIPRGLSFVTDNAQPVRASREISKTQSLAQILGLAREVRKNSYDIAVIFHAPWWMSFVLWLARVPVRIGVKSQWHSFLFFNRGARQKRSRAEVNELEYNYRLLEEGLGVSPGTFERKQLRLHAKSGRPAYAPKGRYYVVHPGMGGSALNWPSASYASLIRRLAADAEVVVTGTAADEAFLAPLRVALSDVPVVWLDGKLNGTELIGVLENAVAVVAPSTGVLHLAASTGVPTLGLFSQIRVQRAVRWGPQGDRVAVVEPPMECPNGDGCSGMTCARGNCMDLITVDEVFKQLRLLVGL